ncbi:hypothetical protein GH714_020371 [Hevea brasiliensis]|uniref:TF-B3 domain-containing protein n=1 Tax=Hevea brasiliensis TaxID=3981 RepID=A0A6A6N5U5_HEVBR|nr:hypothetical protein GH714_020371 [Hevea brasiliensis]
MEIFSKILTASDIVKGLEIPSESRQITIAALPNGQRIEFPVADVEGALILLFAPPTIQSLYFRMAGLNSLVIGALNLVQLSLSIWRETKLRELNTRLDDIVKGLEIPSDRRQITIAALPEGPRIKFPVADVEGRSYTFFCSTDHPKPVFSDGWLKFVGDRGLNRGATITFYMEVLSPALSTTDFALQKGETKAITAPTSWGGRSKLECSGNGAAPPATLAEFKLDGYSGMDCFDVSLVDGYNLPMLVVPQGGSGQNCSSTGCVVDLNCSCPSELKVTSSASDSVACKSASEAFGQPQYCCNGAYSTPDTCKPILLL